MNIKILVIEDEEAINDVIAISCGRPDMRSSLFWTVMKPALR